MYSDLHYLPELLAKKISFEDFCDKNSTWFLKLARYWFRRIHRPEIKFESNERTNNMVGVDVVLDQRSMFNGCNLEDLIQLAKEWTWRYTFGVDCMGYNMKCCDISWETPSKYYRHRCRAHGKKKHIDYNFSKFVAYNVQRKIKTYVLTFYSNTKQYSSFSFEDTANSINEDGKTSLETLMGPRTVKSFKIEDVIVDLDDYGKRVLDKILSGELFVNRRGRYTYLRGSNISNVDRLYVNRIAEIISEK